MTEAKKKESIKNIKKPGELNSFFEENPGIEGCIDRLVIILKDYMSMKI